MDINSMFASAPLKLPDPVLPQVAEESNVPYKDPALTVLQNRERELKTIYIGNIPIETDKKEIYKLFKNEGSIDKIWVRSVPTNIESNKPKKAKVALKDYSSACKTKNCYILFKDVQAVENAVQRLNNVVFKERHLHVTPANKQERDFKSTLFVGNLPYEADEEVLRAVFEPFGSVEYVRIVRDPIEYKCKGFGYVKMADKSSIENIIKKKLKYGEKEIRVSKARKHPQQKQNDTKRGPLTSVAEPMPELKSVTGAERNPIESKTKHEGKLPNSILNRKIKKLKKKNNLTGDDLTNATNKLKNTEMGKFSKEYFEKDNLLKHRRELRKKKKEMNKIASKKASKQNL